jgi:hypothetical protein
MTKRAKLSNAIILSAAAVDAMFECIQRPPLPGKAIDARGLMWERYGAGAEAFIGKAGGDNGALAFWRFPRARRSAVVIMANRSWTPELGPAVQEFTRQALML